MGAGLIGFDRDGHLKLGDRRLGLTLFKKGGAQIIMRIVKIGNQADGGLKLGDGRVQLPLLGEGIAQIVMGPDIAGLDGQRRL